jgi:autotransporter-associated beta strand protein
MAAGGILSNDAAAGTSFNLGALTLTGGELAATSSPDTSLGNFHLSGDVTVSGSVRSTISADVRVTSNQTRDFNVGSTGDASGVDLLITGKLGHQNNVAWGYATKSGEGTMKLSGINELGSMTVNAGRLILEDSAADWGHQAGGLTNNAELEYSVTSGSRGNNGSHGGSGNLSKTGAGTLTLSGGLNYSGNTTIAGGTLNMQGSGGGGTDYNGGNIHIHGASTLRVSGTRYNFNGETFTFNSVGGGTIDAIASGAGGMVFTGSNSFVTSGGARNIISGTRNANEGFNLNGQTATFNVATGSDATSDLQITGTIWNGGNVVKTGAGRLEISGVQQYSGTTTVSGGSLILNGNISSSSLTTVQTGATLSGSGTVGSLTVDSGGSVNPGNSPGILNVDGDYSQAGALTIEINGLAAGTQHDQVNVDLTSGDLDGSVTLSGSLVAAFGGGSYANGNLLFILLNDGSDAIGGSFSGLAQNDIVANYGGFDWRISYSADSVGNSFTGGNDIALMAVPEPGAALLGGLGMLALLRRRRA